MAIKTKNIQKSISLPDKYSSSERAAIGELIVQRIKKRTASGVSANGSAFKYVKKSPHQGDNLKDSGDMLALLGPGLILLSGLRPGSSILVVGGDLREQPLQSNAAVLLVVELPVRGPAEAGLAGQAHAQRDFFAAVTALHISIYRRRRVSSL